MPCVRRSCRPSPAVPPRLAPLPAARFRERRRCCVHPPMRRPIRRMLRLPIPAPCRCAAKYPPMSTALSVRGGSGSAHSARLAWHRASGLSLLPPLPHRSKPSPSSRRPRLPLCPAFPPFPPKSVCFAWFIPIRSVFSKFPMRRCGFPDLPACFPPALPAFRSSAGLWRSRWQSAGRISAAARTRAGIARTSARCGSGSRRPVGGLSLRPPVSQTAPLGRVSCGCFPAKYRIVCGRRRHKRSTSSRCPDWRGFFRLRFLVWQTSAFVLPKFRLRVRRQCRCLPMTVLSDG